MITITVPDGYAIESLPKKVNLAAVENIGTLRYAISVKDSKIQLSINETVGTAIVAADYYDVLQDFFKLMVEKENEKIVLKKI